MKRTTWVAALIVVSVLLILVGCGPAATPSASEAIDKLELKQPVEIVFWHVYGTTQEKALNELVAQFMAENPNIKIKAENAGTFSVSRQKTLAAIAAGSPPDLAVAYSNVVAEYAKAGVIVELDPYVNSTKYGLTKADLDDIYPAMLTADKNATTGKYLSFPPARSLQVMFYNADALKEAGFTEPPKTWDEFKKACVAVTKGDRKGYAYSPSASTFAGWIFSRGGDILSADGKTAKFNEAPAVESVEYLLDLFKSGCAYQATGTSFPDQTDFGNGKAVFTWGSTAGIPFYKTAVEGGAKFNWGVSAGPSKDGKPVVDMFGPSVTIFKSTPEKQLAAWLFIKWWGQRDQTAKWAMTVNYFPLRKSAAESPTFKEYLQKNPVYKAGFDLLPYARFEPNVAGWDPVRSLINDAITAALTGKKTPKQALDDAAAEANKSLAEAAK